MYCGEAIAVKGCHRARVAVSLPCNAWTCVNCRLKRQRQLTAELIRGKPDTFLTITIRRVSGETPEQAAQRLSTAWQKIRDLINREARRDPGVTALPYGAPPSGGWQVPAHGSISPRARIKSTRLPFYAVFEEHKSGWPHLHMLLRSEWIDSGWLSVQLAAAIDSPVVKIKRIHSPQELAGYITKYLAKNPHRFGNCKRYWCSQDYEIEAWQPQPRFENFAGKWERDRNPLSVWTSNWQALGWSIEHVSRDAAIARAPP